MATKQYGVTPEQLDACTRVINEQTHETFYLVASATDPDVTYQVHFNKTFNRLTCNCKAGQTSNTCWHRRAVAEHNRQYHELKRAEKLAFAQQERLATWGRVMNAQPACYTEAEIKADQKRFAPRPFSILR